MLWANAESHSLSPGLCRAHRWEIGRLRRLVGCRHACQSVGNLISFRMGGGPSKLSLRKSFFVCGWQSDCNLIFYHNYHSKFSLQCSNLSLVLGCCLFT